MKPISKKQIEKTLAKYDADHAARLRGLYSLWRNPTAEKSLTQWQKKELIAAG